MSTRIPESLRTQIDATDRGACCYCLTSEAVSGVPLTYDHITPTSRGGLTTFDKRLPGVPDVQRVQDEHHSRRRPAHAGIDSPVPAATEPLAEPLRLESRRYENRRHDRDRPGDRRGVANESRAHRGRPASLVRGRLAPACDGDEAQVVISGRRYPKDFAKSPRTEIHMGNRLN